MDRSKSFLNIITQTNDHVAFSNSESLLLEDDSLSIIKNFPDHSISLILTDPPYHSTKKDNIYGDTAFKKDEEYISWFSEYILEWKRILKPNGSIFCFCSPSMSANIEIAMSKHFNILSHIVWTKPNEPGFDGWKQKMNKSSLRQWYSHSERIIFAEPASEGNLHRSYFGNLLRESRKTAGLSGHTLTEMVGAYGKVNHGGAVSNWEAGRNIPSREQFCKIKNALLNTGKIKDFPDYEDAIRPFSVNKDVEFTDVWNFANIKPYEGKHPAEKPTVMLEHAITSTTFEGDIVLDCFAGSGSTAVAALKCGRKSISIEIEKKWVGKIQKVLEQIQKKGFMKFPNNYNESLVLQDQYEIGIDELFEANM
jgi:site-specific DNA-methyltransferase (adenine-specific)